MATMTYRVDDLDGKTKVTGETTTLSLNGRTVTIDLGTKNAEALAELLAPYFAAGVEVKARTRSGNGESAVASDKDANTAIREWANANGHTVSERGRIPGAVLKAHADYLLKNGAANSTNGELVNA